MTQLPQACVVVVACIIVAWVALRRANYHKTMHSSRSAVIACVHAASTAVLAIVAAVDGDLKADKTFWVDWSSQVYIYERRRYFIGNLSGTDDAFFTDRPSRNTSTVPVMWLALFYALVSATFHARAAGLAVDSSKKSLYTVDGIPQRWADYIITAPTMFVVIASAYGATSFYAILLGPVAIALMIAVAAAFEYNSAPWKLWSWRLWLFVPHLFAWHIPIVVVAAASSNANELEGSAPDFVMGFILFTAVLFSAFAGVYFWHRGNASLNAKADIYYDILSLVSKTTLHLFVGLTVIVLSGSVGESESDAKEMNNNTTTTVGWVGAVCICLAAGVYARQQVKQLEDTDSDTGNSKQRLNTSLL